MTEAEQMKMMIRGAAVEHGVDAEFNESLEQLRQMVIAAKEKGEKHEAGLYMAFGYIGAEIQQ
ncbi:TPA: hypothetical protein J0587_004608 [Salmonella enterica subsp. enterica serovar Kentucky]|nr:hypothetical protein [Salmonella enterica subsp. enterica serovar Kentucky]